MARLYRALAPIPSATNDGPVPARLPCFADGRTKGKLPLAHRSLYWSRHLFTIAR